MLYFAFYANGRSVVLLAVNCMTNPVSTTARASTDRGREKVLDDVHLIVGEEMQWRIFVVVTQCTPLLNVLLYVGVHVISLHKYKLF